MLCDRFCNVDELYNRPSMRTIYIVDQRRSTTIRHRVLAPFRHERRRIFSRFTLGDLLGQLPGNRNRLEVACLGLLGQSHERHATRLLDVQVMFEFIVPILHLCTRPAMGRKRWSCRFVPNDVSIDDTLFRPGGHVRPTLFPSSATMVAIPLPGIARPGTPVIGAP